MKSMNTMSSAAEVLETTDNADNAANAAPGSQDDAGVPAASDAGDAAPGDDVAGTPAVADQAAPAAGAPAAGAPAAGAPAAADSPRALLKQLQQQFKAFRDCLPLAIGIDKQVIARMPNLNRKIMRAALGIHTGSMRYLRAMEKATVRYDLDGTPGAEVTDVHRQHAKELLQQRFKKEAERKKAERDAARAAAAEEEANRKRQEKLAQLASKFSRN
jgi:ProP effector